MARIEDLAIVRQTHAVRWGLRREEPGRVKKIHGLIPVRGLCNPSYMWVNPTYPICNWGFDWIGLRENLQETLVFLPSIFEGFHVNVPLDQSIA